ncbi:MAG TPA: hypothetical protein VKB38_17490 [Terracidiphilus sp.]|nr:hypothetical protein [Terracidiphilus sp.]
MYQPEVTRHQAIWTINLCVKAYNGAMDIDSPQYSGSRVKPDRLQRRREASLAYLSNLPIVFDPPSFQLYIACISHGASIGAIDPSDIGRYCHLAQTAMSAWKLAHPDRKQQKGRHPLPPNGNHEVAEERSGDRSGAPGPSHLGTGEGNLPAEQANEPEEEYPLPPRGNLFEDDERKNEVLYFVENWRQVLEKDAAAFAKANSGQSTTTPPESGLNQPFQAA